MARDIEKMLGQLREPAPEGPDANAKSEAINAAMAAFDAEQAAAEKSAEKFEKKSQGKKAVDRLTDILNALKGISLMQYRIPIAAAATGLLFVPLALHLYSTTAVQPVLFPDPRPAVTDTLPADNASKEAAKNEQTLTLADKKTVPMQLGSATTTSESRDGEIGNLAASGGAPKPSIAAAAPPTVTADTLNSTPAQIQAAPMRERAEADAAFAPRGTIAPNSPMVKMSGQDDGLAQPRYQGGDDFTAYDDNTTLLTADNPVSTFSIDVDTASYAFVRRMLEEGQLPPRDAVRVEEMINYFSYDYPTPTDATTPFRPTVSIYPTPWNPETEIVQIGIKALAPDRETQPPANLVLLIDTSGSMDAPDKLPLLKRSFGLLLDQLGPNDRISIVTYAGSAGTVLEPTPASEKARILNALDQLQPGGSTAGAAGIEEAYRLAAMAAGPQTNNRVILATDGDFNVGISDPEELKRFIERKRNENISLSVLGFGEGNYQDDLMQALAQNGNGNAAYIDSFSEARKVLADQLQGTLTTVAKDVKIQVEFNPETVAAYRLIGYETRALNREDFNNDRVDAGDVGAGHTVTALYEITPIGAATLADPLRYTSERAAPIVATNPNELGFLKLRYKLPNETASKLIEQPIRASDALPDFAAAPADARFAVTVAAFGQKLRQSPLVDALSYDQIRQMAEGARGADRFGYRAEFISLVDAADSLDR